MDSLLLMPYMYRILKVLLLILFHCLAYITTAQHKISGTILSSSDQKPVNKYTVRLNDNASELTDSLGRFEFTNLPNGKYILHATDSNYKHHSKAIFIKDKDESIVIHVTPDFIILDTVVIKSGVIEGHMRGVENMGIYEGKKSDVIIPDNLVVNTATNNARQ